MITDVRDEPVRTRTPVRRSLHRLACETAGVSCESAAVIPLLGSMATYNRQSVLGGSTIRLSPAACSARSAADLARLAPGVGLRSLLVLTDPAAPIGSRDSVSAAPAYRVSAVVDGWEMIRAHGEQLDLASADLRGARLAGASLAACDLTGADLRGADLRRADLRSALLAGADLGGGDLTRAGLADADLTMAGLAGTCLRECYLGGANLAGATLRGADLWGAFTPNVDFAAAHIEGCDIGRADSRFLRERHRDQ